MKNKEKTFKFEIVTPDMIVAKGDVAIALMQGIYGQFGILSGHSSMVSKIYPGVLTVFSNKGDYKNFFISSGFSDVNEKVCSILVEEAIDLDTISLEGLQSELKDQQEQLKSGKLADDELVRVGQEILYTEAKIRAKTEKPKVNF